jgi:DNA-binding CsgD family transcriptional regulator
VLYGRATERARIRGLLADARSGRSGALFLRGPAGSGKTALLEDAAEQAADFQVLRALGVDEESQISFSALDELLSPVVELLDGLAEPQRAALRAAFDLEPAADVARGALSRAVLSVLAAAAESQPLLCLVDDVHLIDPASASALAFTARRIKAEQIAMVFAGDDNLPTSFAGLEELVLPGLDAEAARGLLAEQTGVQVDSEVVQRLVNETGGNAGALMEAGSALSEHELLGRAPLPYPLPIGGAGAAYPDSANALSPAAQDLLVTAAAADTQTLQAIAKEGAVSGVTVAALEECEAAQLIELRDGRVAFPRPLVRAAVYRAAPAPKRRAAHRTLAAASSGERRALHLAAAATGPDEEVAEELERAGESASRRSSHALAANWLERAASFSPEPETRARRLQRAAEAAWRAGQGARAEELARRASDATSEAQLVAAAEHLRARVELESGRETDAYRRLLAQADRVEASDPRQAAHLLTTAVAACAPDQRMGVAQRAHQLAPRDRGETEFHATLALARAHLSAGDYAAAGDDLLAHARSILDENAALGTDPAALLAAADAYAATGGRDDGIVRELSASAVAIARDQGALGALPRALVHLARVDLRAGRWGDAYVAATEAAELAGDSGQSRSRANALAVLARLDALRGDTDRCRERLAELQGRPADDPAARGFLAVAEGRVEEAIEHFERAAPERAPDLVEAYLRAGRDDEARRAAAREQAVVRDADLPSAAARAAWAGALTADEGAYDEAFAAAADALEQVVDDTSFELARLRLNWGERLRRSGRRLEAREHLRAAHDIFELLGAGPWAERARVELRASGETARRRNPTTLDELTPQERQVLREIAAGATYREAAQNLFLSPKTIEFHLRKVYRKLGVGSRQELLARLETLDDPAAHAEKT